MSFISSSFTKIITNAFSHFSKAHGLQPSEIQIMIKINADQTAPSYILMANYKVIREVTFLEILNVKFDLLVRELVVGPFLFESLNKFSEEFQIPIQETIVIISNKKETGLEPIIHLYNKNKIVKLLNLEEDVLG